MAKLDSSEPRPDGTVDRRDLVKIVAGLTAITAAGGITAHATAQDPQRRRGRGRGRQQPEPQPPLPNEFAPSVQFQAAPGGTGSRAQGLEHDDLPIGAQGREAPRHREPRDSSAHDHAVGAPLLAQNPRGAGRGEGRPPAAVVVGLRGWGSSHGAIR